MRKTDLFNAMCPEEGSSQLTKNKPADLSDMILQRMWSALQPISDGANNAANEIRTGKDRPVHNSLDAIRNGANDFLEASSRKDLKMPYMNLSVRFKTSDGKTGFTLIAHDIEQQSPMLFIGIDENNQPIMWDTTTMRLGEYSQDNKTHEMVEPEYQKFDITNIEKTVIDWAKRYIAPEQLKKMCEAAEHEDIINWPLPMTAGNISDPLFDPNIFKAQTEHLAKQLANSLGMGPEFVENVTSAADSICDYRDQNRDKLNAQRYGFG